MDNLLGSQAIFGSKHVVKRLYPNSHSALAITRDIRHIDLQEENIAYSLVEKPTSFILGATLLTLLQSNKREGNVITSKLKPSFDIHPCT